MDPLRSISPSSEAANAARERGSHSWSVAVVVSDGRAAAAAFSMKLMHTPREKRLTAQGCNSHPLIYRELGPEMELFHMPFERHYSEITNTQNI